MNTPEKMENQRNNDGKARLDSILSYSAFFALFILLPVIIASILGVNAISFEQQRGFDSAKESLETRLTQFACDVDSDTFLTRVGRGAWKYLSQDSVDAKKIHSFIDSLKKFLPVPFDLYLFDKKGLLITPPQVKLRSRYVASKLWRLMKASPLAQSGLFKKIRKPVKSLLGGEFKAAQLLDKKDGLSPIIVKHQNGGIYWMDAGPGESSGMLLVFWQQPDLEFRISETVKRQKKMFQRAVAKWSTSNFQNFGIEEISAEKSNPIASRISLLNQPFVSMENEIWIGRKIQNCWVFVAETFSARWYSRLQAILLGTLAILMIISSAGLVRASRSKNLRLSIRLKLTGLFVTAVIIPIMGFWFIGYQYLSDREETLTASVANQSRSTLFSLDESLRNVGESYEKDWKDLIPVFASDDKELIREKLQPKLKTNELVTVEVRDIQANLRFSEINELFFDGMKELAEAFSRFCIDTALGSNLADGVDPIISMVVRAPEGGMFFLLNRPGEIHPLEFGPVPFLIFWQLLEKTSTEKLYLFVVQSASILIKKLVRKKVRDLYEANKSEPFITVARHNTSGEWFPAKLVKSYELNKFSERLMFSDKPLDSYIEINGRSYFVTGQKGKYASEYSFLNFYPRDLINKDLLRIRWLIIAGMLVFLVVAVLTGNILSSAFLLPVARLSQGVNAIKKRDATFRIEPSERDEFGDLSISFNHMIEDLKEMQLARDVQESLLPSGFPEIEGYQLSFTNRMAADVGGDYFDLHRLDENRFCLLVGDVTGHGVSSALVMAMAKAIVYQGLKEELSLIELFSDLNMAIFTYFKIPPARKMITLFAAIIDEKSGVLSCANAGHNFPVLIRSNGELENLAAVHMPIGASKKLRGLGLKEYRLEKDDSVVFYTDGLIEVTNSEGQMYGYDSFKDRLRMAGNKDAEEILRDLVGDYERFLGDAEPDDDLTVIVLKKTN